MVSLQKTRHQQDASVLQYFVGLCHFFHGGVCTQCSEVFQACLSFACKGAQREREGGRGQQRRHFTPLMTREEHWNIQPVVLFTYQYTHCCLFYYFILHDLCVYTNPLFVIIDKSLQLISKNRQITAKTGVSKMHCFGSWY